MVAVNKGKRLKNPTQTKTPTTFNWINNEARTIFIQSILLLCFMTWSLPLNISQTSMLFLIWEASFTEPLPFLSQLFSYLYYCTQSFGILQMWKQPTKTCNLRITNKSIARLKSDLGTLPHYFIMWLLSSYKKQRLSLLVWVKHLGTFCAALHKPGYISFKLMQKNHQHDWEGGRIRYILYSEILPNLLFDP